MFKTVLHYLANTVDNQDVDIATLYQTAARAGDGKIGETLMTTIAEQLIAEGRLEGETKGRLEGEAKGRLEGETKGEQKLIRRQWQLKFPGQPVPDLDHYSLEQLETIGDRLLTCKTPAEVLQGLD